MRAKINSLKQKFIAFSAIALTVAILLSFLSFLSFPVAEAEESDVNALYSPFTEVEVSNGDFGETSETDGATTPSSWTGSVYGSTAENSVNTQVINPETLTQSLINDLKLTDYVKKYGSVRTPFGKAGIDKFGGSDANALFIGSETEVAYGYASTSISLSADSYYVVSAYVKTSDFASEQGASIRISGMENDIVLDNINTVSYFDNLGVDGLDAVKANSDRNYDYGWVEYKFYLETSTMSAPSVTINLMLGSSVTVKDGEDETTYNSDACGFALFDHVTVTQYSQSAFDDMLGSENIADEHNFKYSD